jgi:hypothetical protein
MVAEALTDEATRKEAILRLRDSLKQRKTVVQTPEFAARVNREIGLGSEERSAASRSSSKRISSRAR